MKKILSAVAVAIVASASACAAPSEGVDTGSAAVVARTTQTYVAICGFSLANYDPTETLRFYVESSLTDVSSGQLSLAMTMLPGWDETAGQAKPPAVVTKAEAVGATLSATVNVTSGKYTAALGSLDVPPTANSLTGGTAHVDGLQLDGSVTAPGAPFCAGFSGHLTDPLDYVFNTAENTCLFLPIADGDALPSVQASDFHCP
jgi:hypothetical protein